MHTRVHAHTRTHTDTYTHTLICCNTAARGLTNIYTLRAVPEGECEYTYQLNSEHVRVTTTFSIVVYCIARN